MSETSAPRGSSLRTVLIANRGEIAVRIQRTLEQLGLVAVAVHTDEDAGAPHVTAADRAVRISSYLDGAEILAAARATGADAIHPGYGFLSERAGFARACAEAGVVFIGPSPAAIETMGDKISARAAVATRGVPTVPGLADPGLDDATLCDGAARIGFPLLVKPAAGGGGKGMHAVATAAELPAALAAARREAAGAFGDDTLFLERLIASPRHLEVQILADAHGQVLALGERECSLQRRHQKVIEEAPSPSLTDAQRAHLGRIAVEAARAVDYVGAGTVEFILDDAAPEEPFFLEMNTRLQVEHGVTEAVTGIDLVAEQLRIAAGAPLRLTEEDVQVRGHAIEARLYAEDADAGFLPTGGTVLGLALPSAVRVDHALVEGGAVSSSYDPMLAKVIAHAPTREQALAVLDRALEDTHVLGVVTNTAFLRALLALDPVREGRLDTGLIERHLETLRRPPRDARALAVAALVHWARLEDDRPGGHWHAPSGWRLGGQAPLVVRFAADAADAGVVGDGGAAAGGVVAGRGAAGGEVVGGPVEVALTGSPHQARARIGDRELALALHDGAVTVDGVRLPLLHRCTAQTVWIGLPGEDRELRLHRPRQGAARGVLAPTLESPMPGAVTALLVTEGQQVEEGAPVLVVEAMKMEHTLHAPTAGRVHLQVSAGQRVRRGEELAQVIPEVPEPEPEVVPEPAPGTSAAGTDDPETDSSVTDDPVTELAQPARRTAHDERADPAPLSPTPQEART